MAARKTTISVPPHAGIHELEPALLREKEAWEDWNLREAAQELDFMARVAKKTDWPRNDRPLVEAFGAALAHARDRVQNRDTTRIHAAHSKLERAVYDLRDRLYT